jgi:hypothetical protein
MSIRQSKAPSWAIYLNLAMLLVSAAFGPFVAAEMRLPEEHALLRKALVLCGACAIPVIFACWMSGAASDNGPKWIRPSLRRPPYISMRQPLQVFFIGGAVFLAISLGCLAGSLFLDLSYAWLLFASVGAGCWLGTFVSTALFRENIETP